MGLWVCQEGQEWDFECAMENERVEDGVRKRRQARSHAWSPTTILRYLPRSHHWQHEPNPSLSRPSPISGMCSYLRHSARPVLGSLTILVSLFCMEGSYRLPFGCICPPRPPQST